MALLANIEFSRRDLYECHGLIDRLVIIGKEIFQRNGQKLGEMFQGLIRFIDRRDKDATVYNCVPWGINYLIRTLGYSRDAFYRYYNVLIELGVIVAEKGPNFTDPVTIYLPIVDRNLNVNAKVYEKITGENLKQFIARKTGNVNPIDDVVDNSASETSNVPVDNCPVVRITDIHTTDTKELNVLNNTIIINTNQDFLNELKSYAAGKAVDTWDDRKSVTDSEPGILDTENPAGFDEDHEVKTYQTSEKPAETLETQTLFGAIIKRIQCNFRSKMAST